MTPGKARHWSRTASTFGRHALVATLSVVLSLASPAAIVAGDPQPANDAGAGVTTTQPPGEAEVATQSSTTFGIGDVFVAVSDGRVQWRLPDGTLNSTLDTGLAGYTTGMAFDKLGNLYVTNFASQAVTRFDPNGARSGTFGSGYNSAPESILFNAAGEAYVGQAQGSRDVLHLNAAGQLLATHDVPTEDVGSDWIDLSARASR